MDFSSRNLMFEHREFRGHSSSQIWDPTSTHYKELAKVLAKSTSKKCSMRKELRLIETKITNRIEKFSSSMANLLCPALVR